MWLLGETLSANELNFRELLNLRFRRWLDSQLCFRDEFVQIGFNRLAILDSSEKVNQPISTPSNRYVLVFNGEIYNYRQLIEQYDLMDLRSNSDSEVICRIRLRKKKLFDLLNGMFSNGIYDIGNKRLIMARNFARIKSLFYGLSDEGFVFSSQFDQVYEHHYFTNSFVIFP